MLEKGQMVLDVLLKQGVPVAYTRAHITARVLSKRDRIGKALDVDDTLAALEIDHVTCTAEGAPVEHSTDIFLPRSLDLHVMRWLQDVPPVGGVVVPYSQVVQELREVLVGDVRGDRDEVLRGCRLAAVRAHPLALDLT